MSDEILVRVENVSKKFCRDLKRSLWYGVTDILAELFGRRTDQENLRRDEFWAVKDVSFELKRGECLGLIGHNGAGKSTLLKMLNGLIKPDKGRITMNGRVGALIELGAGFNPILTGRENLYINGQILGFTKREIDSKFESIVEFAEIQDFIDMPVQNYSSGMKVRLGFAVASQMEPDVLIIDEVLAVGDVGFRLKCFNVIAQMIKKSAVIFVSHNMPQVARVSSRIIHIHQGIVKLETTNLQEGISAYYDTFDDNAITPLSYGDAIEVIKCEVVNQDGSSSITYLDDIRIYLRCRFRTDIELSSVDVTIVDKELRNVANCYNNIGEQFYPNGQTVDFSILIKRNQFSQSYYYITLTFMSQQRNIIAGQFRNVCKFQVIDSPGITHAAFQLHSELHTTITGTT